MKNTIVYLWTRAFALIFCSFCLASCQLAVSTPTPRKGVERQVSVKTCELNLELFIRQGADVNDKVLGKVHFSDQTSDSLSGSFLIEEISAFHPIYFSSAGPEIHFILTLDKGRVFGVGMMDSNLSECDGSGGGTFSGPALGDLGDWRGEWVPTTTVKTITEFPPVSFQEPTPFENPLNPISCILALAGVLVLFIAVTLFRVMAPFKYVRSRKGLNPTLHRVEHRPASESGTIREPIAEYQVTYTAADHAFDLSFEIEKASHYLGECGVTIAKTLNGRPEVIALEIWLFDAKGAQTATKILMSDFSYSQEALRGELEKKGPAVLLQPEEIITLETNALTAKAKILQVEYENTQQPNSVFKTVIMKIRVWTNTP